MKPLLILIPFLLFSSCKTREHIVYEERYIDSVVYVTDTVEVELPIERIVNVVGFFDTLRIETSLAKAEAYIDTSSNSIKGKIENKPVKLKKEILVKNRVLTKQKTDTIYKEVKVPITRYPRWLILTCLGLLLLLGFSYRRRLIGILKLFV